MEVYDLKDFPVFQDWNFNKKQFEPRALNKLSVRLNNYLDSAIKDIKKSEGLTEDNIVEYLAIAVVDATKYGVFYNASYEASGPNSHCGGDDSIQEQFVCWALDISVEEYRKNHGIALQDELYTGKNLIKWIKNSELLKVVSKKLGFTTKLKEV